MIRRPNPNDPSIHCSNAARWHLRVLCTPARSHIASAVAVASLIGILVWIWTNPASLASDRSHTSNEIEDAIVLISSRDRLQNRFNEAADEQLAYHERIKDVMKWLPRERSWESIRQSLQATAASSDTQIVALDRGNSHFGSRVAVIHATCEIQGTYSDICGFLSQLSDMRRPIWCDEVRIVRGNPTRFGNGKTSEVVSDQPSCLASLSLRIPFAGKETTAEKLLERVPNHES